jgi:hypothetical protein
LISSGRVTPRPKPTALGRPAHDQVEPHALQPQLEVDDVQRVDLAEDGLPVYVDRLVVEERHYPGRILPKIEDNALSRRGKLADCRVA